MQIQLDEPISRNVPQISSLVLHEMTDYPAHRLVVARVSVDSEPIRKITLWESAEYDAIGQWTDADAVARIKELAPSIFGA